MLRFSIRDLLWTTAFAAIALAWLTDHRTLDARCKTANLHREVTRHHAEQLQLALRNSKWNDETGLYILAHGTYPGDSCVGHIGYMEVNWSLVSKPIP